MHHWLVVAAEVLYWCVVLGCVLFYARRWGHLRKARKAPKLVIPPSSKWHAQIDVARDDGTAYRNDWSK